jgi:hypothetical protein
VFVVGLICSLICITDDCDWKVYMDKVLRQVTLRAFVGVGRKKWENGL